MKRNIKLIVSCIAFIGLGIGIIGAGVNYFFNHSVLGMEQGLAGSTQNSNEANQVCYITPENPDADMTLEDTTEADLQAEQYAQPETLLGQHTVSLGTCVFQQKRLRAGAIRLHLDMDTVMKHSLQMADRLWIFPAGLIRTHYSITQEWTYTISGCQAKLLMK